MHVDTSNDGRRSAASCSRHTTKDVMWCSENNSDAKLQQFISKANVLSSFEGEGSAYCRRLRSKRSHWDETANRVSAWSSMVSESSSGSNKCDLSINGDGDLGDEASFPVSSSGRLQSHRSPT